MSEQSKGSSPHSLTPAEVFERLKRMHTAQVVQTTLDEPAGAKKTADTKKEVIQLKRRRPPYTIPPDRSHIIFLKMQVRGQIESLLAAPEEKREQLVAHIGAAFLRAVERGNPYEVAVYIDEGFPVNYQNPRTGQTALHIAAACQARKALRILLKKEECDLLLRDNQGRLASEMAYLYGEDPAVARLLGIKERKQAEAAGITLTRRPSKKETDT